MKAIIFTTDAIFALIIAMASLSLLLFFNIQQQTPYITSFTGASSLLSSLQSANLKSIKNSSEFAYMLYLQNYSSHESSPAFDENSGHSGYVPYGPQYPTVAFVYSYPDSYDAHNIGVPIAAYGNIYFIANTSNYGTGIYSINATTGASLWSLSTNAIDLLAYDNMIVYVEYTSLSAGHFNITARSPLTGALIWSRNISSYGLNQKFSIPSIVEWGGSIYYSTQNGGILKIDPNNGTVAAHLVQDYSLPSMLSILNGSLVSVNSGPSTLSLVSGNLDTLWTQPATEAFGMSTNNDNMIFAGTMNTISGASYYSSYFINGTTNFQLPTYNTSYGVASALGVVVYQSETTGTSTMAAYTYDGTPLWLKALGGGGSSGANITYMPPIITSNYVYSFWPWSPQTIIAQNLSTGAVAWEAQLPSAYGAIRHAFAAYGRLYVQTYGSGNTYIIAIGSQCGSYDYNASVLALASQMYIEGMNGCAVALLNQVNTVSNYGLTINGTVPSYDEIAYFDGYNSNLSLGYNPNIGADTFTWSFWINPEAWNNGGILGESLSSSGHPYMAEEPNSMLEFTMDGGNSKYTTNATIELNQWQYVAGTYNLQTGVMNLYVNGNLVSTANSLPGIAMGNGDMQIGELFGNHFNGFISDLQIYSQQLNRNQISALYSEGIQGAPLEGAGLAAWYPLAGDGNNYANNMSYGNGFPYDMLYLQPPYTPPGIGDSYGVSSATTVIPLTTYATYFDGNDSYVSFTPRQQMNAATALLWVKTTSNGAMLFTLNYGQPFLFMQVGRTYSANGGNPDQLVISMRSDTGSVVQTLDSGKNINDGRWHMIALAWDGSEAYAYIDGKLMANMSFSGTLGVEGGGGNIGGFGNEYNMTGLISDAQLYDSYLSPAQISQLYSDGLASIPLSGIGNVTWISLDGNQNAYTGGFNDYAYNVTYTKVGSLHNVGVYIWH
ncbi:MAG: PQQ-binding-like beta-propeller repeat protein [Candidatus Marsarchaeota archaeon]|nr:PQQ-binding-like beta-propeller repeat protein [Candidatus Marsarchaeota archaeon]